MLTVYTQYSFGGYKIYRLSDNSVDEVTGLERLGLPQSAVRLFSHYGIKLICSSDIDGNYILFVNDMPCREKDDIGRSKTCSMLISSRDRTDVPVLRRIAVMIAFELDVFEAFFCGLFAIKDTLTFDYARFKEFLGETSADASITDDRLRHRMCSEDNPIIIYATSDSEAALDPLYNVFEKKNLRRGFLMKWDGNSRTIKNHSIERIGFLRLIQQIINKIAIIWKN